MIAELDRLVALSPPDLGALNAAVREVCPATVGLAPLPAEGPGGLVDPMVIEFAEQFSADVTGITGEQRAMFADVLGPKVFGATVLIFIADFVPRMRAGFAALGHDWRVEPVWDHDADPTAELLDGFVPAVGRMRALDPLTSESFGYVARASTTAGCASRCAREPRWTPGAPRGSTTRSTTTRTPNSPNGTRPRCVTSMR